MMRLAVLLCVFISVARAFPQQTIRLSETRQSSTWTYGNGDQSNLTLSCGVHGFGLTLESPEGTTAQVQITSPSGSCQSDLRCDEEDAKPDDGNGSYVNPADYEDEMSFRIAPVKSLTCAKGSVDWAYETCMNKPVKKGDDGSIVYTATALIKQSHALAAIAPCKLDHQTIVELSCCVTPPELEIDFDKPGPYYGELKACERAQFSLSAEPVQSNEVDHISWSVFSDTVAWANHDHVGWFVESCTGSTGGKSIDLFHHTDSNVVGGRTQNCDFPDLTVAMADASSSKPQYSYVFDMPFVLPAGSQPDDALVVDCKVRFCNKPGSSVFNNDCPADYPVGIDASHAAPEPTCSPAPKAKTGVKGKMLLGKVSVDHIF